MPSWVLGLDRGIFILEGAPSLVFTPVNLHIAHLHFVRNHGNEEA